MRWRKILEAAGLALLLGLVVTAVERVPGLAVREEIFGDILHRSRREAEVSEDVRLVEFDRTPVPKDELARAIAFAGRHGAAAVLVDVLLDDPRELAGHEEELSGALARAPRTVCAIRIASGRAQPPVLEAARRVELGYANLWTDADGVVRRTGIPPGDAIPDGCRPLALVALDLARERSERFSSPPEGPFRISFPPAAAFEPRRISAGLLDRLPASFVEGRIVLLGYRSPDPDLAPHDLVETPIDDRYPGLYVHAASLDTVLAGRRLEPAPPAATAALVVLSLFAAVLLAGGPISWRFACPLALAAGYLFLGAVLHLRAGLLVPAVFPVLAILASAPCLPAFRRLVGEFRARALARAVRRLPPFVARPFADTVRLADPFARLDALISVLLAAIRWNAIQVALRVLEDPARRRPHAGELKNDLRRPTFGNWVALARELSRGAPGESVPGRIGRVYRDPRSAAMELVNGRGEVRGAHLGLLPLRNRLRHGARASLPPAECESLLHEYGPDVRRLLLGLLPCLEEDRLLFPEGEGGLVVWNEAEGRRYDPFPFLLLAPCEYHGRRELFFYEGGILEAGVAPEERWLFEGRSIRCLPRIDAETARRLSGWAERILDR